MGWWERNVVDRVSADTEMDRFKRQQAFNTNQDQQKQRLQKDMPMILKPNLRNKAIQDTLRENQARFEQLNNQGQSGFIRDRIDSSTPEDRMQRLKRGTPESYREEQIAKNNKRPIENLGGQVIGNSARLANTIGYGLAQGEATRRGTLAQLTGNDEALSNALEIQRNLREDFGRPDSYLHGMGTIYDNPEEMMNLGNAEIAKRVGLTTLGTASEILPYARVARPVTVAGKFTGNALRAGGKAIPTTGLVGKTINAASIAERGGAGLAKRAAFNAGIDITTGAGDSAARQYAQTGTINPTTLLADTAASTVMGQAQLIPAYGKAIGNTKAGKQAADQAKIKVNRAKTARSNADAKLSTKFNVAAKALQEDYNALRKNWETATPQGRKRIDKAIKLNRDEFAKVTQGGFALDPSQSPIVKKLQGNKDTNPLESLKQETTLQDALEGRSTKVTRPQANSLEVKPTQELAQSGKLQTSAPNQSGKTTKLSRTKLSPASQQAKRTSTLSVSSKKSTPIIELDNTPNTPSSKEWGDMLLQADTEMPRFDAVAGSKGTNNARRLVDAINSDNKVTKAAKEAQNSGKELNFFAKADANNRSVGIEQFNPKNHRIEAGFVVDKDGNALGNHIKVDNTGIQVNVGGDLVNLERVIGNPTDWKGKYRVSETMSRNIDSNAPGGKKGAVAKQTKDYLVGSKVKAEANYRVELEAEYKNLGQRINNVESARPKNISKNQFKDDIFSVLNGDKKLTELKNSYDAKSFKAIETYTKETRKLYDSLLERINAERVKFGMSPVEGRKDYITHLQELSKDKSFTGEVYNSLKNSFTDEGMQKTRGGVPAEIAGRTENFKPQSSWNRFMQQRTGEKSLRDPFDSVQAYLEPALYNIHMTEATVRARAVESAFRTADKLQRMNPETVLTDANSLLKNYKTNQVNDKLTRAFSEYANALAKKTNRLDRVVMDSSDATASGLKLWQEAQRVGGRATILGNVSSVFAQPLNQAVGLADAGPTNYLRGIIKTVGGDSAINKSPFITARRTQAVKPIRGVGEKILDAGGIPLQKFEMASIEILWNAQHAKAVKAGKKAFRAIQEADYNTERIVAGRGIADRPELYRSTVANGFLQYTLEVTAQHKAIMKDLSPSQKATFVVSAAAMNYLWGNVTGYEPLPDFLKAAIDTGSDFLDEEDQRSAVDKAIGGVQRGSGEYASMNPLVSTVANVSMTPQQRKEVFGSDSSLGMFEGTAAPIKVGQNAYSAVNNVRKGNLTEARNDALRVVPFGNQARKSITGLETINRGYSVDRSGNPTFAAPDSAYGKAQSILFGPSSTSNARNYYDNNGKNITGKADMADINRSTDKRATVSNIQARKASGAEGGEFMGVDDREGLLQAYRDGGKLSDVQKRIAKTLDEMPQGLSKESQDELVRESGFKTDVSKKYYKDIRNKLKLETAEFERDSMTKTLSKSDEFKRAKDIAKLTIAQEYGGDVYDMYSLALYELESVADDETYKKLVAYDRKLYENDLISKPKFKQNKRTGSKSGRGGTKKSKFDATRLFGFGSSGTAVNKSLRQLLEQLT